MAVTRETIAVHLGTLMMQLIEQGDQVAGLAAENAALKAQVASAPKVEAGANPYEIDGASS